MLHVLPICSLRFNHLIPWEEYKLWSSSHFHVRIIWNNFTVIRRYMTHIQWKRCRHVIKNEPWVLRSAVWRPLFYTKLGSARSTCCRPMTYSLVVPDNRYVTRTWIANPRSLVLNLGSKIARIQVHICSAEMRMRGHAGNKISVLGQRWVTAP